MTWRESVDEALCFGWIDGVRRSIDTERYTIRFTPRRARSVWSAVNIERVAALTEERRMRPAGRKAFEARREDRSGIYSYEQRDEAVFDPAFEKRFRARRKAWADFEARPAWYRQAAIRWVMTAKKQETRERRLTTLIDDSAAGRTIAPSRGDRGRSARGAHPETRRAQILLVLGPREFRGLVRRFLTDIGLEEEWAW